MKIMILGGAGIVGQRLIPKLKDHEIIVIDYDLKFNNKIQEFSNVTYIEHDLLEHNCLIYHYYKYHSKLIIHLADVCNNISNFHSRSIKTNIGIISDLITTCSFFNTSISKCIVGCWNKVKEYDMMTYSFNSKRKLIHQYNKGNNVITPIHIPIILHPNYTADNYMAFVNRVYNNVKLNSTFYIHDNEIYPYYYVTTVDNVLETIINSLNTRRTRDKQMVKFESITFDKLVGYALDIFDKENITVFGRNEPYVIQRDKSGNNNPIKQCIRKEWRSISS